MTNLQIKKEIEQRIKRLKTYRIDLTLWHGDGTSEGENIIYNDITIYNTSNGEKFNSIYYISYGTEGTETSEDDMKRLKSEQKKLATYLKKHFENINCLEDNV